MARPFSIRSTVTEQSGSGEGGQGPGAVAQVILDRLRQFSEGGAVAEGNEEGVITKAAGTPLGRRDVAFDVALEFRHHAARARQRQHAAKPPPPLLTACTDPGQFVERINEDMAAVTTELALPIGRLA